MKHLRIKPKKIITIDKVDIDVSRKVKTITLANQLYIKYYEKGVAIRMRNQSEIILPLSFAGELALLFRDYSFPQLHTSVEFEWVMEKFKYNKGVVEFILRVMKGEVTREEMKRIEEENRIKDKVTRRLTGEETYGSLF